MRCHEINRVLINMELMGVFFHVIRYSVERYEVANATLHICQVMQKI